MPEPQSTAFFVLLIVIFAALMCWLVLIGHVVSDACREDQGPLRPWEHSAVSRCLLDNVICARLAADG